MKLVSIIIPVYNAEQYLAEAIESILKQSYTDYEIIIVDDGSTDGSAQIAKKYPEKVKYFYQNNQGVASARNVGLQHSRGDMITFLDADDLWSSASKLQSQIDYLATHAEVDMVLGCSQALFEQSATTVISEKFSQPQPIPILGAMLFRKSIFTQVGQFDAKLLQGEDLDLLLRAKEQEFVLATEPVLVLYYRRHDNNLTNLSDMVQHYFLRMLRLSINRRRKQT